MPRDDDKRHSYYDKYEKDHYDRPSWSELDKKKNKSSHTSTDDRDKPKQSAPWQKTMMEQAKKNYLDHIGKMFEGKKGTTKHDTDLSNLKSNIKKESFPDLFNKYVEEYGFPQDWEILISLLDSKDSALVQKSIETILQGISQQTDARQEIFKSKLKIMKMTTTNRELSKFLKNVALE